jgi:Leucine-rich repeat (LRR) protein
VKVLNLSNNRLTDSAVQNLTELGSLKILNLYGNQSITDASIQHIASIQGLETVYLWGTGVTDSGYAALTASRPELEVQGQALPR